MIDIHLKSVFSDLYTSMQSFPIFSLSKIIISSGVINRSCVVDKPRLHGWIHPSLWWIIIHIILRLATLMCFMNYWPTNLQSYMMKIGRYRFGVAIDAYFSWQLSLYISWGWFRRCWFCSNQPSLYF